MGLGTRPEVLAQKKKLTLKTESQVLSNFKKKLEPGPQVPLKTRTGQPW
jgi:hypothetical protein